MIALSLKCLALVCLGGVATAVAQELGPPVPLDPAKTVTTESGLKYQVVTQGRGPVAKAGDRVLIHETTQLLDGTVITDTWAMNFPLRITLGAKQAIDGLDEALTGMRVGERRRLIIPPSLSKRSSYPDNGLFGPDDVLYYDVILLQASSPQGD